MMRTLAVIFAASFAASAIAAPPVKVVVNADRAYRADAARLQSFVETALRHVATPRVVTIHYYGPANAPHVQAVTFSPVYADILVLATFTISDPAGNVLDSEWVQYDPFKDRLKALYDMANLIAKGIARVSGS